MNKKPVLIVLLSLMLSSCSLWPYEKDFDCPVEEGFRCKSLHEISELADEGIFKPENQERLKEMTNSKRSYRLGRRASGGFNQVGGVCNGC